MFLIPKSKIDRTHLKNVDQGSGQGVPWIDNGADTQYVSITIHGTTQPWALRRIFEMGSSRWHPAVDLYWGL